MGVRKRRARKRSRTHIIGFGLAGVLGFVALLVIALAISVGALVNSWLQDLPDYQSADAYLVAEPTQVYDADNNVIAEYYLQNRRSVTKDQVSQYVLQGTVDTEDVRFYQHNGVDPQGIARAIVVQFTGGSEGASTITQQLVRNTVLSNEQFEQTLKRKVREAYIAIQMEKKYSKDQILMMYLNTIYYGHSAYGIEAASITYFNKDAKDLTLAEAALLVGLPQSPSYYDPTKNPEAATTRRNTVLDRMLTAGHITQEQHDEAQAEPLTLNEGEVMDQQGTYPYFTDYVKTLLQEDFDQDTIMKGGLKVYTTIDPDSQQAAQDAVDNVLGSFGNDKLDAALVAIDPSNGYIKAMIGGKDYNSNKFNLATQAKRQPGSSFKVFTLAAAIREGMNPDIYINANSPIQVTSSWNVQNYGNESYGTITLREAMAVSSNTAFAQVAQTIGADKIVAAAKDMGIDEDLPAYPSITLGTEGVPVVQMAEAYSTLAADGVHHDSVAITKIEDRNGNTVYEHQDSSSQALEAGQAEAETDVLEGVCQGNGTAAALQNLMTVDQPVAGKTGTSENYRDLWFCGYTPQVALAVWTGYQEEGTVTTSSGSYAHPYQTAVPIFANYVNTVLAGQDREEFANSGTAPTYKDNSSWTFSSTPSYVNQYNNYSSSDSSSGSSSDSSSYGYSYGSGSGYSDSGDDSDYSSDSGSGYGTRGSGSGYGYGYGYGYGSTGSDGGSSSGYSGGYSDTSGSGGYGGSYGSGTSYGSGDSGDGSSGDGSGYSSSY